MVARENSCQPRLLRTAPVGLHFGGIAYGVHIYGDVKIAEIAKEWFILEGLEFVVSNRFVRQLKGKMETLAVPTPPPTETSSPDESTRNRQSTPNAVSGIVNVAVADSLTHLGKVYSLEASRSQWRRTDHADRGGARPIHEGTLPGKDEKEWGTDEVATLPDADDKLKEIQDNISDSKASIRERMNNLKTADRAHESPRSRRKETVERRNDAEASRNKTRRRGANRRREASGCTEASSRCVKGGRREKSLRSRTARDHRARTNATAAQRSRRASRTSSTRNKLN